MNVGRPGISQTVSAGLLCVLLVGAAGLAPSAAQAGTVTLQVADWLPAWDVQNGGGWGLVPSGTKPTTWTAFSGTAKALTVANGKYDAYWVQNKTLPSVLLGAAVNVGAAGATVPVLTGVKLVAADWAHADGSATWAAMPIQGGTKVSIVNASQSGSMVLAPGDYDIYWKEGADTAYGWVQQVTVTPPTGTLGVQIDVRPEGVHVVAIALGGPAERAGLRADDLITAIDGKAVAGIGVDATLPLMRGAAGSVAKLTVKRLGATALAVTREASQPITVRIDSGMRLAAGQTLAIASAMGWWGAMAQGEDPTQVIPVNRTSKPGQALTLPPGTYDVYWSFDGTGSPVRLASRVVVETGRITDFPISH